ncbi:hypothetical protein IWW38_004465, partial [Coemansia aciculifera]
MPSRSSKADAVPVVAQTPPSAGSANFIMSSPKRKPREAFTGVSTPENRLAAKRRKSDSSDDASLTPKHTVAAVPGFHSPLLKRMRPALNNTTESSDESSSAPTPSTKRTRTLGQLQPLTRRMEQLDTSKGAADLSENESGIGASDVASAANLRSIDALSLPFKYIYTPVADMFRRVSGIVQDPFGLQNQDSVSSDASEASSAKSGTAHPLSSDVFVCAMPGALDQPAAPPPGSLEANSLTAPPMNPTTIVGGGGGACMQLYLPESIEVGGSVDSCSASPVTSGYPETPSKENIPMYGEYDFDAANDEITAMSSIALANIPPAVSLLRAPEMTAGVQQESDLDLSQISSLADSDIDAQYEQYLQYDEDEDEFNPYLFMADLPPIPKEHTLRPYALPRKTRSSPPITLVLDLDETLVHCALTAVENADLVFPVEYNGLNYDVYCRLRPGYQEFLERASELFEVVVFTASQQVYADRLLNRIDPERRYIKHRLFRDSCVYVNTNYVKDLGILGRDESKMILVDNCPQAFAYQQSNGIPIESWYEDRGDRELKHLMDFLETLVGDDDVRPKVEAHFRTREKVAEAKKRFQIKLATPYQGSSIY